MIAVTAGCRNPLHSPRLAPIIYLGGNAVGKAKDVAAIKRVIDDWVAATNAGDAVAGASLFTDDGILMLPNEPAVIGKEAIRSHLQAHFDECGGAGTPRETDALY